MSFQAYIDNIKAKTGNTPADFKKLAEEKNFSIWHLCRTEHLCFLSPTAPIPKTLAVIVTDDTTFI